MKKKMADKNKNRNKNGNRKPSNDRQLNGDRDHAGSGKLIDFGKKVAGVMLNMVRVLFIRLWQSISDIWKDFLDQASSIYAPSVIDEQRQKAEQYIKEAKKNGMSKEDIEKMQEAIQRSMLEQQQSQNNGPGIVGLVKDFMTSLVPSRKTLHRVGDDLLKLIRTDAVVYRSLVFFISTLFVGVVVIAANSLLFESDILYWLSVYTVVIVYSYLMGSIPFGYFIVKYNSDKDLRKVGSGNIGSTNVVRAVGYKLGSITLVLDVLKTILAIVITEMIFPAQESSVEYAAGVASFVGHLYPFWLHFKGGKGVASAFGVIVFLSPVVGSIGLTSWLLTIAITRISSISSLVGALVTLLAAYSFDDEDPGFFVLCLVMVAMIIYRHKSNIRAIYSGEEKPVNVDAEKDA